jgi:hypothetical protein
LHANMRPRSARRKDWLCRPFVPGSLELKIVTRQELSVGGSSTKNRFTGLCTFHQQTTSTDLAIDSTCPVSIIYHTPEFPANFVRTLGRMRRYGNLMNTVVLGELHRTGASPFDGLTGEH